MKRSLLLAAIAVVAMPIGSASAWYHAGGYSASGNRSSWSASDARGGTASGGNGSWNATGARGGTASGGGGSWNARGAYGGTASGTHYYSGGYYSAYHPPTVVNHYGTTCYNCGGWNTGGAVAAGVAVGAAVGVAVARAGYVAGNIYPALPGGCSYRPQGNMPYYGCSDGVWFVPSYGANGIYYRVVDAP
ncbi:MAG: RNA-binding protein [Reyranellales bacterium]